VPEPTRSELYQDALLWPCLGMVDGEVQLPPGPTPIKVRWNTTRTEMLDPQGQKISLDGSIRVKLRDVPIDSLLWLGTMDEWHGSGTGSTVGSGSLPTGNPDPEVVQVKAFTRVLDLKTRESSRVLGFIRYRGSPPP
jgi:hypothetical protein